MITRHRRRRMPPAPDTGAGPVLTADGLGKVFSGRGDDQTVALQDVDISIEPGEFFALLGPSGCGKSTLLKLMAGLLEPSYGQVRIRRAAPAEAAAEIGLVFQQPNLLPWRTVTDNVLLPADVLGLDMKAAKQEVHRLLSTFGLADFARAHPKELSGGMQQRVAIARALVHDPSIVLMDEPFGALDAMTREQMQMELLSVWSRFHKTVVLVTHSIAEAILLADRVAVMTPRPGRITRMLTIDLPRPRTLDLVNTAEFGTYVRDVRDVLESSIEATP